MMKISETIERRAYTCLTFATLIFLSPLESRAAVWSENFSTVQNRDPSSTAVWNLGLRQAHSPFVIDRATDAVETEDETVVVGDGSLGPFSSATMANFSSTLAPLVTLSSLTTYSFSDFHLPANTTLRAVGSLPLQIFVQGNVLIEGVIDVSGEDGKSPSTGSSLSGGDAGPGGAEGGDGGSVPGSGGGLGGGPAGIHPTFGVGSGGGGGTFGSTVIGSAGEPGDTASAVVLPIPYGSVFLTDLVGGSGGGGGGKSFTLGRFGGSGGGGGGVIRIEAGGDIRVASGGAILARGGDGGDLATTGMCASGGGGSGGAILLVSGNSVRIDGTVDGRGGSGGVKCSVLGGDGGYGRTRIVDWMGNWASASIGFLLPYPELADYGKVFHTKSTVFVQTTPQDSGLENPVYTQLDGDFSAPTGSTVEFLAAGSSDNFQSDDTGFVDASQLSRLQGKRYFRLRANITAANRQTGPNVSAMRIEYSPRIETNFEFGSSAGCARVSPAKSGSGSFVYLIFTYLMLLPSITARVRSCIARVKLGRNRKTYLQRRGE